jgi:uncharacterized protein (TIGR01777 family)
MKNILITGGSGRIGKHLIPLLKQNGHNVAILTRKTAFSGPTSYAWNPENREIDLRAFENTDTIIHLAGAPIAGARWTKEYKRKILESRVNGTRFLAEIIASNKLNIKSFISASAVGFYGNSGEEWVDEESSAGNDFLSSVCIQWEAEAKKISESGVRTVIVRTGQVLSDEGLMPVISRPVKFGAGAVLGTGNQFMSWIHYMDLCRLYLRAVEDDSIYGIYNATAPQPVPHRDFMKKLAAAMHRPLILPRVPGRILKMIIGEKADLILGGQRVACNKIIQQGFMFEYGTLENALNDLL